mmetsp:Transcript_23522/g.46340  ORF Transcript_23522/g.46340 Transcript_23522/m.46340 type:complete len:225 (-) Transcript_23522:214-888(-)
MDLTKAEPSVRTVTIAALLLHILTVILQYLDSFLVSQTPCTTQRAEVDYSSHNQREALLSLVTSALSMTYQNATAITNLSVFNPMNGERVVVDRDQLTPSQWVEVSGLDTIFQHQSPSDARTKVYRIIERYRFDNPEPRKDFNCWKTDSLIPAYGSSTSRGQQLFGVPCAPDQLAKDKPGTDGRYLCVSRLHERRLLPQLRSRRVPSGLSCGVRRQVDGCAPIE